MPPCAYPPPYQADSFGLGFIYCQVSHLQSLSIEVEHANLNVWGVAHVPLVVGDEAGDMSVSQDGRHQNAQRQEMGHHFAALHSTEQEGKGMHMAEIHLQPTMHGGNG
jgi:hypothetical protein